MTDKLTGLKGLKKWICRHPLRFGMAAVSAVVSLALGWATLIAPGQLVVVETTLELPRWEGKDLRVVVLADLHVGAPHIDLDYLDELVARTNELSPDLILLAGDFLITGIPGGEFTPPEIVAKHLSLLKGRLGVFAVLGNHDWWFDGPRTAKAFEAAGIPVLENQSRTLEREDGKLRLVGIGDHQTRHASPTEAFSQVRSDGGPILAFTHAPDVFPEIAALDLPVALSVAGHTHGGQVRLPFFGTPIVPSKFGSRFVRGHIVEDEAHYYVTSGVGTSTFPIRFGVTPEIVVLTLSADPK